MAGDRSRYGLLVSALGAVLLAVSVFLPWYGVSLTAGGVALVQQFGDQLASQYGNASLQAYTAGMHAGLAGLAGHQLGALSAHQVLKDMNIFLLVLAGLAMLDTLFALARSASSVPEGAGGSVVLVGAAAAIGVIYRMVDPPNPVSNVLALSLREGAWLALLGCAAMIAGGLWPRGEGAASSGEARVSGAWTGLSGWTPGG